MAGRQALNDTNPSPGAATTLGVGAGNGWNVFGVAAIGVGARRVLLAT